MAGKMDRLARDLADTRRPLALTAIRLEPEVG
jgi:hypothetical protein